MKKQFLLFPSLLCYKTLLLISCGFLFYGCASFKDRDVINRSAVPEVRAEVPASESEIREIKYYKQQKEARHKDLHISGQLFTKEVVNGSVQIRPCAKCIVTLRTPNDTSMVANLPTESDGYFTYHGLAGTFKIIINNPGYNQIELGNIDFQTSGVTAIKIISAAGTGQERIMVSKTGSDYSWSKIQ
jgi:hypothetical protein